jgi:hypothetical protein
MIFDTSDVGEFGLDGFPEFPFVTTGDDGFATCRTGKWAVDKYVCTVDFDDFEVIPFMFKKCWIFNLQLGLVISEFFGNDWPKKFVIWLVGSKVTAKNVIFW